MSLEGIVKDNYGYPLELEWIDPDTNAAGDLSGYTTAQYLEYKNPGGDISAETASYTTDGSEGLVKDVSVAENLIDEAGGWNVRIRVESGTSVMRSRWTPFEVQG